jgi:hypothetical protein
MPPTLNHFHEVSRAKRSRIDFHGDLINVVADSFQLNQQRFDVLGNVNFRAQRSCNKKICNAELSLFSLFPNDFFLCFCQTNRQCFRSFSDILHAFLLSEVGPGYGPVFYVRGGQPRALLAPAGGPYEPPLPGNPAFRTLP